MSYSTIDHFFYQANLGEFCIKTPKVDKYRKYRANCVVKLILFVLNLKVFKTTFGFLW